MVGPAWSVHARSAFEAIERAIGVAAHGVSPKLDELLKGATNSLAAAGETAARDVLAGRGTRIILRSATSHVDEAAMLVRDPMQVKAGVAHLERARLGVDLLLPNGPLRF